LIDDSAPDRLRLTQPRVWLLPAVALLGMLVVAATGANERVFLWLNALGPASADGRSSCGD